MIARIWHGLVSSAKSSAYREFLKTRAIPDYQSVDGNLNVYILERADGDVTHFITLTFWRDMESIKGFAGNDVEIAKYYPEDADFLLEYEPTVAHYEIVGQAK
jgi:heme-degrading monooxygenase HmoA